MLRQNFCATSQPVMLLSALRAVIGRRKATIRSRDPLGSLLSNLGEDEELKLSEQLQDKIESGICQIMESRSVDHGASHLGAEDPKQ